MYAGTAIGAGMEGRPQSDGLGEMEEGRWSGETLRVEEPRTDWMTSSDVISDLRTPPRAYIR